MQLGTFSANIVVDGKALEEYDVAIESPTKVTCWVASEEGKSFGVQWRCHESLRVAGTNGRVCVDGTKCGHGTMYPDPLGAKDTYTHSWLVRGSSKQALMFARVQLSDDDSLLDKKVPKDLGEISLEIRRGKITKKPYYGAGRSSSPLKHENQKLHERSKKSIVHCTVFGPERHRGRRSHVTEFAHDGQPELVFVFKYRPLGVLQANGIAPRSAPVHNGYAAIEPARVSDRIQMLEDELKHLRDLQASNSEDRKPSQIKREDPREGKRPLFAPGEVIDLT